MTVPARVFVASYENMERAEKAARAEGWDGTKGEMLDYIDAHGDPKVRLAKRFYAEPAAVDWLKAEIIAMKSLFGAGQIRVLEAPKRRCQYCVCDGLKPVRRLVVTDDGIEEDDDLDDICHSD